MKIWQTISTEQVYDAHIFKLEKNHCITDDKSQRFDFHTLRVPDWVHVIPILKQQNQDDVIVLVKQFRHGIKDVVLEFPAGTVENGEKPEASAMRELKEETGYDYKHYTHLISYYANPAFMSNTVHAYIAELELEPSALELDPTESIEVVHLPLQDFLNDPTSFNFRNGSLLTSLYYYKNSIQKNL